MNPEILNTLVNTCWACGTVTGIFAAWFKMRSIFLSKQEDREALQEKYRARWQSIRDGGYLELPERGVIWLIRLKDQTAKWSDALVEKFVESKFGLSIFIVAGPVSLQIHYGMTILEVLGVLGGFLLIIFVAVIVTKSRGDLILPVSGVLYSFVLCITMLQIALSLNIYWTVFLIMIILPIIVLSILMALSSLIEGFFPATYEVGNEGASFSVAFAISFLITAIALLIGSFATSKAYIPQTVQMFLANALCDGFTLLLTYVILGGAVTRAVGKNEPREVKRKYPLYVAITLDVGVAAFIACLSLYLGLLGSDNALSIKETVNVLVAHSPSGATYELGPYFWAMHTTFIPTIIYLTVIALGYVGKLFILPIFHVFRKGHAIDKPHDLTAAVFAFVTVLFAALGGLLSRMTPEQLTLLL